VKDMEHNACLRCFVTDNEIFVG